MRFNLMTLDQPIETENTPMTPTVPTTLVEDDGLGIDRAFILQMAQIPFIAGILVVLARISHQLWGAVLPNTTLPNLGPMVVLALAMILAAAIDGYAFKVPNWLTLSTVVSGWVLGILHSMQVPFDSGEGGFSSALMGTFIGFILIFPALFIGGMGQGDVKMQMGFGSWIGAFYGAAGYWYIVYAFCAGAIVGGIFGVVIILLRRRFGQSREMFGQIFTDLKDISTGNVEGTQERAHARRPDWIRLPYGVPLCVGFVGFLIWKYTIGH